MSHNKPYHQQYAELAVEQITHAVETYMNSHKLSTAAVAKMVGLSPRLMSYVLRRSNVTSLREDSKRGIKIRRTAQPRETDLWIGKIKGRKLDRASILKRL